MMCSRHRSSSKMLSIDSSIDFLSFPFLLLYMQTDGNDSPLPPLFKSGRSNSVLRSLSAHAEPSPSASAQFHFFHPKTLPECRACLDSFPGLCRYQSPVHSDEITHVVTWHRGTGGKIPLGWSFLKKSMQSQQCAGMDTQHHVNGEGNSEAVAENQQFQFAADSKRSIGGKMQMVPMCWGRWRIIAEGWGAKASDLFSPLFFSIFPGMGGQCSFPPEQSSAALGNPPTCSTSHPAPCRWSLAHQPHTLPNAIVSVGTTRKRKNTKA